MPATGHKRLMIEQKRLSYMCSLLALGGAGQLPPAKRTVIKRGKINASV